MPSKDPKIQKALKDGTISKKQYEKMPDGLLLGIIKRGGNKGTKKGGARKGAMAGSRLAFDDTKQEKNKYFLIYMDNIDYFFINYYRTIKYILDYIYMPTYKTIK